MLYIYGKPGSGKSTFARILRSQLTSCDDKQRSVVAYFLRTNDLRRNKIRSLLISLVCQILDSDQKARRRVDYLYKLLEEHSTWTVNELWAFLDSVINAHAPEKLVCIIDAIDEIDPPGSTVLESLTSFAKASNVSIKVFVTSQSMPADLLKSSLGYPIKSVSLENRRDLQDCASQIVEVSELVKDKPAWVGLEKDIRSKISGTSFTPLQTSLVVKQLRTAKLLSTPVSLRATLQSLPHSLPDIYEGIIKSSKADTEGWVRSALTWIVHAAQHLTTRQLAVAIAVESHMTSLNSIDELIPVNVAESLEQTLGFMIRIEKNDEISLVHETARTYLLNEVNDADGRSHFFGPETHDRLTLACLKYLSMILNEEMAFIDEDGSSPQIFTLGGARYGLLNYAVQYWPYHYHLAGRNKILTSSVIEFLHRQEMMVKWSRLFWFLQGPLSRPKLPFKSHLDIAASLGFLDVVPDRLSNDFSPVELETALNVAAGNGHIAIVDRLLRNGAKWESAIHIAALKGPKDIICNFLKQGPTENVDIKERDTERTALHLAARGGYVSLVGVLLKCDAHPNSVDKQGSIALHAAAASGHVKVVKTLLGKDANQNATDKQGRTPISLAARYGHDEIS
ncbi:MAG: hypothetical protein MMC33_003814, partial [Icmadophila ericetorum]|nr:hypothetical protein [Icmadophila ericetorum]